MMREKIWSILYFGISILALVALLMLTGKSLVFSFMVLISLIGISGWATLSVFILNALIFNDHSDPLFEIFYNILAICIILATCLVILFIL